MIYKENGMKTQYFQAFYNEALREHCSDKVRFISVQLSSTTCTVEPKGLFTPDESGSESEKDQRTRKNDQGTRMHSSRMRTGRSLTVCRSLLRREGGRLQKKCAKKFFLGGGVSARGVSAPRWVCSKGGVSAPGGGVSPQGGGYPSMH